MVTIVQCVNNLDVGGLEQMVLSLAGGLRQHGLNSMICCIENRGKLADQAEAAGVSVHALNMSQKGKLSAFRNFCALLRRSRESSVSGLRSSVSRLPVVLHSHNFKPFYYSALATMLHASNCHIHTRHGTFIEHHKALWRYRLLRRGVNKIVTVSADRRAELAQLSGLPVEQIGVVPNGVDTNRFHPAADKAALRRKLGLPVEAKLIIVAARLSPEKDLGTLLRAFRLVLDRWDKRPACPSTSADNQAEFDETRSSANGYPTMPLVGTSGPAVRSEATTDSGALGQPQRSEDASVATGNHSLPRLVVVGDGLCATELRNEANRLDIARQVDFLGMRTDVPQLLQAADVFALSSISEGLSMALIEAATCGLPIVATAVGGNAEIVNAPHGGQLVPARNPEAMAVALANVLGDDARRQAMGTAARQHAVAKFSLDRMVDDYILMYQQAIGGNLCPRTVN